MNKINSTFKKAILFVMSNMAFMFAIIAVNTTCCGPGYQPSIPSELDRYIK